MREQELLDALAKGPGGVQVNVTENGCTVSTRYNPTVTHRGPNIQNAAFKVAAELWRRRWCPHAVRVALQVYDENTAILQL